MPMVLPLIKPVWSSQITSLMQDCNLLARALEKILKSELSSVIGRQLFYRERSDFFGISVMMSVRCSCDREPC